VNARRRTRGFVLASVLILLALSALLVLDALGGAASATALATRLQLRQRAFDAAEAGLAGAAAALAGSELPAPRVLTSEHGVSARVTTQVDALDTLPLGFSAGRFAVQRLHVTAVAQAPRNTTVELQSGYSRRIALP
jgi:hypothetical protein